MLFFGNLIYSNMTFRLPGSNGSYIMATNIFMCDVCYEHRERVIRVYQGSYAICPGKSYAQTDQDACLWCQISHSVVTSEGVCPNCWCYGYFDEEEDFISSCNHTPADSVNDHEAEMARSNILSILVDHSKF